MSLWRKVSLKSLDFRTKLLLSVRRYNHEAINQKEFTRHKIGNREIVRSGLKGQPSHALREKEKGDWRNLTIDEKMCLYRDSFTISSTFEKVDESSPEWKSIMAWTMFLTSLGFWLYIFILLLLIRGKAPSRFDREHVVDIEHINDIDSIDQYYRAIDELMKNEAAQNEASK